MESASLSQLINMITLWWGYSYNYNMSLPNANANAPSLFSYGGVNSSTFHSSGGGSPSPSPQHVASPSHSEWYWFCLELGCVFERWWFLWGLCFWFWIKLCRRGKMLYFYCYYFYIFIRYELFFFCCCFMDDFVNFMSGDAIFVLIFYSLPFFMVMTLVMLWTI